MKKINKMLNKFTPKKRSIKILIGVLFFIIIAAIIIGSLLTKKIYLTVGILKNASNIKTCTISNNATPNIKNVYINDKTIDYVEKLFNLKNKCYDSARSKSTDIMKCDSRHEGALIIFSHDNDNTTNLKNYIILEFVIDENKLTNENLELVSKYNNDIYKNIITRFKIVKKEQNLYIVHMQIYDSMASNTIIEVENNAVRQEILGGTLENLSHVTNKCK